MADSIASSFIHELTLTMTPSQLKTLDVRLDVARQIYNACLGEALIRLKLMRESKAYQCAVKMPKHIKKDKNKLVVNKARRDKFKEAKDASGFSEYGLHKYLTSIYSSTWLTLHVDSLTAQKVATRAFKAVEQYAYGRRGKPRFRAKNRFSSIEGKNNASGIRFIDGKIIWSTKGGDKLELKPRYALKDKDGLEAYALSCRTKYVRLIRRTIKGHTVWYAQLVQEGAPYIKPKNRIKDEVVGLDIGPSSIAVVGEDWASLQAFCPEVEDYRKQIGSIQRKMSRSLRAMNPDNFEADSSKLIPSGKKVKKLGKVKKGPKTWIRSKKYQQMRIQVSELQRKMSGTRKTAHGTLANKVLSAGKTIKTEKLSYSSFQKNFGKSVGFRAPGLFVNMLRCKAESAGGEVIEFNTRTTALSQACHCGSKQKKSLKERWHKCEMCGITSQRDLYSAFLARFVKDNRLDTSQATKAWASAGILLEQAVSNLNETAIGKARLASFGLGQSQSGSPVQKESIPYEALDVVACA